MESVKETDNRWLSGFARQVTSQAGEDGIIEKMLEVVGSNNAWCVEFGSWDGKKLSNTYNLIANRGFSAVLIEGDPVRFQDLKRNFQDNPKVTPVNAFVGFTPADCLDKILEKTAIPQDFDLLSIDIDGNDYHVWEAVKKYQPKIVVIEFNPTMPGPVDFVQPLDMTLNQGSSLRAMVRLAKTKGYELAAVEEANAFFVNKDLFGRFGIKDNSINTLWTDDSAISYVFYGYDGKVFLRGLDRHPWQQVPILESKLQLIPDWVIKTTKRHNYLRRRAAKIYLRMKKSRRH